MMTKKLTFILLVLFVVSSAGAFARPKKAKAAAEESVPAQDVQNATDAQEGIEIQVHTDEAQLEKDRANAEQGAQVASQAVQNAQGNDANAQVQDGAADVQNPEDLYALYDAEADQEEEEELDPKELAKAKKEKRNYIYNKNLIVIPHRILEFGFDMDVGFANNFFNAKDLMKKELVIDLPKMADDVPDNGWLAGMLFTTNSYMNLNTRNNIHIGIHSGLETSGTINISKELFDYIGNGTALNEGLDVSGEMNGDLFLATGADVGFDIFGFHVEAKPSLFRPLMHAESDRFDVRYTNPEDGSISLKAGTSLSLYSALDLQPIVDGDFSASDLKDVFSSGWGFDLQLDVEHKIFDTLQGAAYMRIPMVPGTLGYSTDIDFSVDWHADSFQELVQGDTDSPEKKTGDPVYGTAKYYLHRPFRMGAQVAWRPFGKWCTFDALLGMGVKHPYIEPKAYCEYNLGMDIAFLYMVGLKLSSGYFNEVFRHQAGVMLNLRVFELNFGVSAQGSDFAASFKGAGVGAYLGVALGF